MNNQPTNEVLSACSIENSGQGSDITMVSGKASQSKFNLRQIRKPKFYVALEADSISESDDDKPKNSKFRSRYHSVSNEKRLKLICLVNEQGKKIKLAARKLGINYSTAKSIYQIYKREGRTTKKDIVKIAPTNRKNEALSTASGENNASSDQVLTKSNLNKPCHDDLEASTMRKKVKKTEKLSSSQHKSQEEALKLEEENKEPLTIKIESHSAQPISSVAKTEDLGILTDEQPITSNFWILNPELQKTLPQPLFKQIPGSIIVPTPIIPNQLSTTQKPFSPTDPNLKLQSLSQLLSQQIPQHLTQQFNQLPVQAPVNIQNDLLRFQELQMLNNIIANNLLVNNLRACLGAQASTTTTSFQRVPYFF